MTGGKSKMLVIGLDGTPPDLIFEKYRTELPHIQQLMQNGVWEKLQSCHTIVMLLSDHGAKKNGRRCLSKRMVVSQWLSGFKNTAD